MEAQETAGNKTPGGILEGHFLCATITLPPVTVSDTRCEKDTCSGFLS